MLIRGRKRVSRRRERGRKGKCVIGQIPQSRPIRAISRGHAAYDLSFIGVVAVNLFSLELGAQIIRFQLFEARTDCPNP
eukprot:scaffold13318_cov193-Alexandrium_tamarense.AAC.23